MKKKHKHKPEVADAKSIKDKQQRNAAFTCLRNKGDYLDNVDKLRSKNFRMWRRVILIEKRSDSKETALHHTRVVC